MFKIAVVVPTIRPDRAESFLRGWDRLFSYYDIIPVMVYDGEEPTIKHGRMPQGKAREFIPDSIRDCFYNYTDSVRNYGFWFAASYLDFDYLLTLDDDVLPIPGTDPIAEHVWQLGGRSPLSWMNTGNGLTPYFRGVPYGVRTEAENVISHGVWCEVPDYDGPTQLTLTNQINPNPRFYEGPVPRGIFFPFCGMNVMFKRKAVPLAYYAPMGPSTGFNRFGDIWAGIRIKKRTDALDWAIVTGHAKVEHSRASDTFKNIALEAEGLRENETYWTGTNAHPYFTVFEDKAQRYETAMAKLLKVEDSYNLASVGKASI